MEKIRQPTDKWLIANSLNLHYLDWDNPDAAPMVLLHGLCGNAHYWDFFSQGIKNYHVLAPDQRGHGDSSWAKSYAPRDYVLDLEAFVTDLGLNDIVLIGHSLGGINAVIYAARHPDLVSRLVIVDIGPEIATAGTERLRKDLADTPEAFDSEEEAVRYMKQTEPRYSDAFIQREVECSLKRDEAGRLRFKYDRALLATDLRSPEWLWEYLEQVICPTLLIHGAESDILLADIAQRVCNTLAFGTLVDIDRAGHSIPGDNPEAFEAAVRRFLTGESPER